MSRILALFTLLLLLTSCEKKIDWMLKEKESGALVIDGIITDELKTQSIRIMRSYDSLNGTAAPVIGAQVIVSGNGEVYTFSEHDGNMGYYTSDRQFSGAIGKEYSLLVSDSNRVYSAKTKMDSKPDSFIFARYQRVSSTNLYQFVWISEPYSPFMPAMYELLLDWSDVYGYQDADSVSTHARLLYYTLPTLDVSEIFAPAMEKVKFPTGTKITERRYSLTLEYAAFIRAMLLETTWQGGFFTTATANVPTNLSTGALGYFAACSINEQAVTVDGILSK